MSRKSLPVQGSTVLAYAGEELAGAAEMSKSELWNLLHGLVSTHTHFVVILMGMMKYMIVGSLFRQTLIGFPARFVSVSVLIGQSFSRSLLSVHASDRSLGAKICRPSPNRRSALNVGTSNAASTWLSPNQGIGGKADADLVDHNLWRLLVAEVAYQRLIHRL